MPYSKIWPGMFRAEAARITAVLGDEVVAVHHIGSTAVPGMSAKPIMDILLEVRGISRLDRPAPEMACMGYGAKGEFGIPGRRFFVKPDEARPTHHVHAYGVGDPEIERHLAFRDYVISHPEDARDYARLKEDLARRFPADIEGYVDGKDAFVSAVEKRAMIWRRPPAG